VTDAPRPLFADHEIFGTIRRCPRKLLTAWTHRVAAAWKHYEKGLLPADGGWEDQEAKLMEGIEMLDGYIAEIREAHRKEDDRR